MSEGVSRGIVELVRGGRLSATSVMSTSPIWPAVAAGLREVAGRCAVGLHLTLTWGAPLGPMPVFAPAARLPALGRVLAGSLAGRLPRAEIVDEIGRQIDEFVEVWGGPPAFIDGHQHVHVLPGIRGALIAGATARGLAGRTWIRDPADTPVRIARRGGEVLKAASVAALSTGFGAALRRAGFATNRGFAGFSDYRADRDVPVDFDRYLSSPGPDHLVMCHPGHVHADELLDGVVEARRRELAYLASDRFAARLREGRVTLVTGPSAGR